MNFQDVSHRVNQYEVTTNVFAGPLDLLLELIERAELDITKLALAQVTDQYLQYLQELPELNAAEVSSFLVIASRLLQIKSSALLPKPVNLDPSLVDEEDPGEALARQLIIYKRFKELAGYIRQRDDAGLRTHLRLAPPPSLDIPIRLDLSGLTIHDLVLAAQRVFYRQIPLTSLEEVVNMPRITIREKINEIIRQLKVTQATTFRTLLGQGAPRLDVIVTFLAMLELIKRQLVEVAQPDLFGDISIDPNQSLDSVDELVIESDEI